MTNIYILIVFVMSVILTEAITEIVTKSELFEPLRSKVFKLGQSNKFFKWLHSLLDCGYCFSVWSGILIALLFFKDIGLLHWSMDWFFVAIVLHRSSNLFHNVMDRIHGN